MKKKHKDYDYESIYSKLLREETREEKIEDLRMNSNYVYMRKKVTSGDMVEIEVYPIWKCKHNMTRSKQKNESKESQKKLNKKNSEKKVIRLINTNFEKDDLFITLTYEDGYLPDEKTARKDIQNYIRRLKRYREKNGLPELKYIYSIGFENIS
jgi:hypothetical protein